MKTAIVHEWLATLAGSEKVVEQFCNTLKPEKLFTLIDTQKSKPAFLKDVEVETSFIQKLPFSAKKYRGYLPLMPLAVERFDVSGYDLVISSHHCVAHGVLTGPSQLHIAYTHSPMRYIWDLQHQYFAEAGLDRKWVRGKIARLILHYMRIWDRAAGQRPDFIVANSKFIASRVRRCYQRQASVIYPPVDVDRFTPNAKRSDYYLTASRLVPYKMIGLIVKTFSKLPNRKLVVIGDGPDRKRIEQMAGPNVEMLGYQSDAAMVEHLQNCRAFVYAAEEDFGILPVEAQASGAPTIALGRGGTRETVVDGETGVLFESQSEESILNAIHRFESHEQDFATEVIRTHAEKFSIARFNCEFSNFVDECLEKSSLATGGKFF